MTTRQTRPFSLELRGQANDEYDVSLASDFPVNRGGYVEILDMSNDAIDLSRAAEGLPLLSDHGRTRLGRINRLRTDGKRLRGALRFFDTEAGREARAEVDGGHREVSIGYEILKSLDLPDGSLLLTRWRPYEGSIVAVPADPTVGINRSHHQGPQTMSTTDTSQADTAGTSHDDLSRAARRAAGRQGAQETERIGVLTRTAHGYRKYVSDEMLRSAVDGGLSVTEFNAMILDRMETGATDMGSSAPAFIRERGDSLDFAGRYSMSRAVQAMVDPVHFVRHAGFEAEISKELQRRSGIHTGGIMVPAETFFGMHSQRGLTAGAAGAGGSTVPTLVPSMWIDALRQRSVVLTLGAQTLPLEGPSALPKKSTTSTTGWLTETGDASTTDLGTGALSLTPKRIGAFSDVSRQLVITSALAIDNLVQLDLRDSVMADFDLAAMLGTGASNQPTGVSNSAGVGAVVGGTDGADLTWQHILDLEKTVDDANGLQNLNTAGYAINGSTRSYNKRTAKSAALSHGFIMDDMPNDDLGLNRLNGYRCAVTGKLPKNLVKGSSGAACSLLIFGDWSQLVMAIFGGGVEIIVDPYTLAKSAQVRITANMFVDVGVRHSAAFAVMKDAKLP